MENECHMELVSRLETQWEYTTEWRYTPPQVEVLDRQMLKETAPACEITHDPMAASRVEGIVYVRDTGQVRSNDASRGCELAYIHIRELVQAWSEWNPHRAPKAPPSLSDFLAACRPLSKAQQACLVMPFGKKRRADCEPYLATMTDEQRERLDELLSESKGNDPVDGGVPSDDGGP
jgi:hypothetical protein